MSEFKSVIVRDTSRPLLYHPIYYYENNVLQTDGAGYVFRYRIVSEDLSRVSHWSPIQTILTVPGGDSVGSVSILSETLPYPTINVTWSTPNLSSIGLDALNIDRPRYDIFVGYDNVEPVYHGTAYGKFYSFIQDPLATTNVRVVVQVESYLGNRSEYLQVFDSGIILL